MKRILNWVGGVAAVGLVAAALGATECRADPEEPSDPVVRTTPDPPSSRAAAEVVRVKEVAAEAAAARKEVAEAKADEARRMSEEMVAESIKLADVSKAADVKASRTKAVAADEAEAARIAAEAAATAEAKATGTATLLETALATAQAAVDAMAAANAAAATAEGIAEDQGTVASKAAKTAEDAAAKAAAAKAAAEKSADAAETAAAEAAADPKDAAKAEKRVAAEAQAAAGKALFETAAAAAQQAAEAKAAADTLAITAKTTAERLMARASEATEASRAAAAQAAEAKRDADAAAAAAKRLAGEASIAQEKDIEAMLDADGAANDAKAASEAKGAADQAAERARRLEEASASAADNAAAAANAARAEAVAAAKKLVEAERTEATQSIPPPPEVPPLPPTEPPRTSSPDGAAEEGAPMAIPETRQDQITIGRIRTTYIPSEGVTLVVDSYQRLERIKGRIVSVTPFSTGWMELIFDTGVRRMFFSGNQAPSLNTPPPPDPRIPASLPQAPGPAPTTGSRHRVLDAGARADLIEIMRDLRADYAGEGRSAIREALTERANELVAAEYDVEPDELSATERRLVRTLVREAMNGVEPRPHRGGQPDLPDVLHYPPPPLAAPVAPVQIIVVVPGPVPLGSAPVAGAAPAASYYYPFAAAPAAGTSGAAPGADAAPTSVRSVTAHIRLDGVSIITVNGRTTVTASNGASRTIDGAIQSWSSEDHEVTITTTTGDTLVFDGRDFVSGEGADGNRGVPGILDPSERTDIVDQLREFYRDEISDLPVSERTRELNARARELVASTLEKEVDELSPAERHLADALASRARSRGGSP